MMKQSSTLHEVVSMNKTKLRDYEEALNDKTVMLMQSIEPTSPSKAEAKTPLREH